MPFDSLPGGSGGSHDGPWCVRCHKPVLSDEPSERISFPNDPHGHRGLTGLYHARCAKPFSSLAHIMNLRPFA